MHLLKWVYGLVQHAIVEHFNGRRWPVTQPRQPAGPARPNQGRIHR